MIKYVFFDVAGTLIYKPDIYVKIRQVLKNYNISISLTAIKTHHIYLSNLITFPNKTTITFYRYFNENLLYSLGIKPSDELLGAIYHHCHSLAWKKFPDTSILNKIQLPIGIISNWDSTLQTKLSSMFLVKFWKIFCSSDIGLMKPDVKLYTYVLKEVGCKPEEITYIGDSLRLDIEPAHSLGINTILLDRYNSFAQYTGPKVSSLYECKKFFAIS